VFDAEKKLIKACFCHWDSCVFAMVDSGGCF